MFPVESYSNILIAYLDKLKAPESEVLILVFYISIYSKLLSSFDPKEVAVYCISI